MPSSTSRRRFHRWALAGAVAAIVAAPAAQAVTGQVPGTAGAQTITGVAEAPRPAFYEPPATVAGDPGTIVRTEPASYLLDPLGLSSTIATATKVMYVSRDRLSRPIAVTGIVIVPKARWLGSGKRPLISYAAGTQGMADRCAPSRVMVESAQYEIAGFGPLVTSGYAVAMTDYQGLGTPGTHTYMNRAAQGQAVLDMARAAQRLPGSGLSASTPVGIMGYSQGGGAAAAAVELLPAYAPELKVKGALLGAVPADLAATGTNLDGGLWAAFLGYATIGLAAGYDQDPMPFLNDAGQAYAVQVENSCVFDFGQFSFQQSSGFTADGRPLTAYLAESPWKEIVAEQTIGTVKPTVPVRVTHSALDDTIPYAVGKAMAKSWCSKGGNVVFSTNLVPTHLGGAGAQVAEAPAFFAARFAGWPQWSNCWTL